MAAATVLAGPETTNTPPPIPSPFTLKSPVDFFRDLLAASPAERKKLLADRSPDAQKQIMVKVREYESLKPDVRELRLRVTELQWYLLPLMRMPATNRTADLAMVPAELRKQIEDRVRTWDRFPPEVQKTLLENEATLRYFTEQNEGVKPANMSKARQEKLQASIAKWQGIPVEDRRKIVLQFQQCFELTDEEKARALKSLPEAERRQIERTLVKFRSLPPGQRAKAIGSFEKFASLSLEERQQFLKNAERWTLMSPNERQQWRDLVQNLERQPPMPPGFNGEPMPPPLPRAPASRRLPLVTNTN